MAIRGRKPKPKALKAAQGNPGKRALSEPEAGAPREPISTKTPAPPRYLSQNAKTVWKRMAPHLADMRFLRASDHEAFARYCEHLATFWSLTRELRRKKGMTYVSKSQHGELERVRPAFMIRERIEKRLEALEDRFGLSPRARYELMRHLATAPLPPPPAGEHPGDEAQDGDLGELARAAERDGGPIGMLNRSESVH